LIVVKAWVGLSEAAKILGAHPATVRNWADQGDLPSQRTPGGHRRFRRVDLAQWLTRQGASSSTEAQLLVQSAMGRARQEIGGGHVAQAEWYQSLDPAARTSLSTHGRQLMEILQRYLTSPESSLDEVREIGLQYGALIRSHSLSLSQAISAFFTFDDFILDSVLQVAEVSRPGGSQREALRKVYTFTRTFILALVDAYQSVEDTR
jgi:excisionase family DNA binding protein